jgi:hypothetical protein
MTMLRLILSLSILLAALASVPTPASALENIRQYVFASLGAYMPDNNEASTNSCLEVGYGIAPIPYLGVEAMVGFMQTSIKKTITEPSQEFILQTVPMTVALKASYPIGLANIYALGGGGLYYSQFHFNGDQAKASFATDDDDLATGYFYGVGGELQLGNVSVGVLAKKLNMKASFAKVRNSPPVSSFADFDYSGTQLQARIIYNF